MRSLNISGVKYTTYQGDTKLIVWVHYTTQPLPFLFPSDQKSYTDQLKRQVGGAAVLWGDGFVTITLPAGGHGELVSFIRQTILAPLDGRYSLTGDVIKHF